MRSLTAYGESRLLFWQRVRECAVPPSMIESATARRAAGDWAGACAAARVNVDLDLRAAARAHGRELAARVRADLRQLAPDLLRWHMPRIAPDGLLRPGLTVSLADYQPAVGSAVHLVARTPPAWADAGQRISLALWDGSRSRDGSGLHPHPRPDRRFRLDLHRHLWNANEAGDLRERAGAGPWAADGDLRQLDSAGLVPAGCAVDRWASEAATLLRSQGRDGGTVTVRLAARHRLMLHVGEQGNASTTPALRITATPTKGRTLAWPDLPDAATWVLPDLALLRTGLIDADQLHPLVAAALVPGRPPARAPRAANGPRLVECRGTQHRIGLVDGVLVPLDHDPAEIRREALLAALGGTPLPCLRAIDDAHRHPECLVDVRARLDHGDAAGALAAVENLLGPDALLRSGALRDELETAALRRVTHGLYRAGLAGSGPIRIVRDSQRREVRSRPRHTPSR
jgi:hypothetical protein